MSLISTISRSLLIGMEGSLEHFIDFASEEVDAPYISFVTRGKCTASGLR